MDYVTHGVTRSGQQILGEKSSKRQTTGRQTRWVTDVMATGWDVWATVDMTSGRHK